ncbi:hypothetical protein Taro_034530 [Colocasia esculenta]|uniref:Uncharacterized protein n=1 Tax=Colocasia esculenta TaxID=4460 RepID=A0A843W141_COLES|nr:hypothetical protein [Colocasia esculenta]
MSQARVFVVLRVCPGTCVVSSRSVSSVLDTLTHVFELYDRLRERRQRTTTCVELVLRLVTCSALVVGGTDTSRRTGPQLVLLPVPHFRELRPESLKVPGMDLQCVCPGVGTVVVVVSERRLTGCGLPRVVCPSLAHVLRFCCGGVPCGGTGLVVVFVVVLRDDVVVELCSVEVVW